MQERTTDFSKATSNTNYPSEVLEFLEGTKHIPITKGLTAYVNDITKDSKTPLQKHKQFMTGQFQLCIETKV